VAIEEQTTRNRVNQRNFRSRRQQYIKELEDKVRHYERAEVEATSRIQAAARLIAQENEILRHLVRDSTGCNDHELNQYLSLALQHSSRQDHDYTVPEIRRPLVPIPQTTSPNPLIHGTMPTTQQQLTTPNRSSLISRSSPQYQSKFDDPIQQNSENPDKRQGSSMSCEEAALIISSISSVRDPKDIREQLGCRTTGTCHVENMEVFQVMGDSM
jgi:hypothetical protein